MTQGDQVNKSTYDTAKTYLQTALEQMLAAGRSAREFGEFALEKFGDRFVPYLQQFSHDISKGRIKIEGLGKSAKNTVFGRHVTFEEREQMIREAAYLRAERRGFAGGSPEEDWRLAEQEVDQRLAQETGLVEKGRQALASVGTIVEREFDDIRQVVSGWLESKPATEQRSPKAVKKAAPRKAAATAPMSSQEMDTAQKKTVKKKAVKKKAATSKTTTPKETVKG